MNESSFQRERQREYPRIFLLAAVAALMVLSRAQVEAQEWAWARITAPGQGSGKRAVAVDANGSCFVNTGNLNRSIVKFDPEGKLLWRREGCCEDLAVDRDGNLLLLGLMSWKFDFGDTNQIGKSISLTNSGSLTSMFLVKLGPAGEFLWAQQSHGYDVGGDSLAVDANGSIFVSGSFRSSVELSSGFLKGTNPVNGSIVALYSDTRASYLAKYSADGNLLWAQKGGGFLAVGKDNHLYMAGEFSGTTYFGKQGTNLTSSGASDMFIAKYDPEGNLLWVHPTTLGDRSFGRAIALDDDGNIFARCQVLSNQWDNYLLKLSPTGQPIWTNLVHSGTDLDGFSLGASRDGYTYATWFFSGTISFRDYALTARGIPFDDFLVAYNPAGKVAWAKQVGGYNNEFRPSLAVGPTGDIWLASDFEESTLVGSMTLEEAGWHMLVARLNLGLPSVVNQPKSVRTDPGANVSFCVGVTNASNPRYQWRWNEVSLSDDQRFSGTTTACLTISNVQTNDAGTYSVVIQANNGTVASSPCQLWFGPAAQFMSNTMLTNGDFMVEFSGEPGRSFDIQVSTNLGFGYWTIFTNFYCPQGTIRIIDRQAKMYPNRFYRAVGSN